MMSNGSGDDIPGAPSWVRHFFNRIDARFDVLTADLALAVNEFRSVVPRTRELEERVTKAEAQIVELRREIRSMTPPAMPVTLPPKDAA